MLALRPSGDVTVHTSKRIQPTIQPLMVEWGRLHLRHANESAGWVEDESVDDGTSRLVSSCMCTADDEP